MKLSENYNWFEDTTNTSTRKVTRQKYKEQDYEAQLKWVIEWEDISMNNIWEDMDAEDWFLDRDSYLSDWLDKWDANDLFAINNELDALEEEFFV